MENALASLTRPVRLLAAGGTISMQGERAVPALDAEPARPGGSAAGGGAEAASRIVLALPGAQIGLDQALELARRAKQVTDAGEGVVITTGTDTLEELAVLCALLHDAEAPIVLTGANRPASRPGADGPANLLDAVTVAGAGDSAGLGTTVVFGGEIHAAMTVRKVDSTGPAAFGRRPPGRSGGWWRGGCGCTRARCAPPTLRPDSARSPRRDRHRGARRRRRRAGPRGRTTPTAWWWWRSGAGHLPPGMLRALQDAVARMPVLITCRVDKALDAV